MNRNIETGQGQKTCKNHMNLMITFKNVLQLRVCWRLVGDTVVKMGVYADSQEFYSRAQCIFKGEKILIKFWNLYAILSKFRKHTVSVDLWSQILWTLCPVCLYGTAYLNSHVNSYSDSPTSQNVMLDGNCNSRDLRARLANVFRSFKP